MQSNITEYWNEDRHEPDLRQREEFQKNDLYVFITTNWQLNAYAYKIQMVLK